jgi:hypothetical protein
MLCAEYTCFQWPCFHLCPFHTTVDKFPKNSWCYFLCLTVIYTPWGVPISIFELVNAESEFLKSLVCVLNTQHRKIQQSAAGAVGEWLYLKKFKTVSIWFTTLPNLSVNCLSMPNYNTKVKSTCLLDQLNCMLNNYLKSNEMI